MEQMDILASNSLSAGVKRVKILASNHAKTNLV
jgi:hypothetical protein